MPQMAAYRAREDSEEDRGEADEEVGEYDEVAERLDVRQDDDGRKLEDVHEHVEGVLDAVDDATLLLTHALLQELGDDQVSHPQT